MVARAGDAGGKSARGRRARAGGGVAGAASASRVRRLYAAENAAAAALMLRRNLNRVLITEPGSEKLVGIISSTDVFRLAFGDAAAQWREEGTEKAGL